MHDTRKPPHLAVRLWPEVASVMQKAALAEDRTVPAQVNRALREWAIGRGYTVGTPEPKVPTIISRQDAIAAGMSKYYSGVPCSNGHTDYRYVARSGCCSCLREATKRHRSAAA